MKKQRLKGFQNLSVIQSNVITRSAQGLSLVEKRILITALAQTGGVAKPVIFSAKEYAETFELDIKTAYNELLFSAKNFMKRSFTIPSTVTYKNKIYPSEKTFNWLSYVNYSKDVATIEIKFNPDIYDLLFELTEKFTKYNLKQASALRSLYSVRLLELLEQMRKSIVFKKDDFGNTTHTIKESEGWLKIDIDDFNTIMEVPKTYRKNFKDLNNRVIQPAIKELKDKDDWLIDFKAVKSGRRYKLLMFKFEKNKQMKLGF